MARPAGLEPATLGLEGRCSIQLSYGRKILNIQKLIQLQILKLASAGLEPATVILFLSLVVRQTIQLSYGRKILNIQKSFNFKYLNMLPQDNLHPALIRRKAKALIFLRKIGRSRGIRTPDPLVPNQMRYQAALCSE